jgi:uncharacterized protein (DUF1810 family)
MNDLFDLSRFVDVQHPIYDSVVSELRNGEKRGHWMWYIFPQVKGLGVTSTSVRYAISSKDEAIAYLGHPILGGRLKYCTELVLGINDRTAAQIFHYPDTLKFCSCMTLFDVASGSDGIFKDALQKYFDGRSDQRTIDILSNA